MEKSEEPRNVEAINDYVVVSKVLSQTKPGIITIEARVRDNIELEDTSKVWISVKLSSMTDSIFPQRSVMLSRPNSQSRIRFLTLELIYLTASEVVFCPWSF